MEFVQGKFRFSKGRQPVHVVAAEVSEATGIPLETLLTTIPDLTKIYLSAGAYWTSEHFAEHPVGVHNSLLSQGWIEVKFPSWNVEGDVTNDMSDVMRSHAINTTTGEIHSFPDFEGSDEWLASHLGYISIYS